MLTKAQNERLTQVGTGTPCGALMRRYWHAIAPTVWLDKNPVRSVRILGEDLTLYRDRQGRYGLVGQRCPHRRVDLRFGIPENDGLRCPYHGWMFDGEGHCVEMPLEPPAANFKDKISIAGYPAKEMGGLIWAYLGPLPAPELPQDDLFVREDGFRQIIGFQLPCNWLQVMENRADIGHAYYTHGRLGQYVAERMGLAPEYSTRPDASIRPLDVMRARGAYPENRFIPNEYGFAKSAAPSDRKGADGDLLWDKGLNPVLFPYQLVHMNITGDGHPVLKRHYQIGVPIDDTTTWHFYYLCYTFPPEVGVPKQTSIPYREVSLKDENGEYVLDYTTGQDQVVWYAQGETVDRSEEHLGYSDSMLVAFRKMLDEQITLVERGDEPMNVFRDASKAYKRDLNLESVRSLDKNSELLEATRAGGRPGGWSDLKVDWDIGRYCPDRDVLEELYQKTLKLWNRDNDWREEPELLAKLAVSGPLKNPG